MRPWQWSKNLLLFAALLFARKYTDADAIAAAGAGFALFTLSAGCLYLLNDLLDIERDRMHPEKRLRPIAAGIVPTGLALVVGCIGIAASIAMGFLLNWPFGFGLLTYVGLHLAYSVALKHLVIIDIMTIAFGFVVRAASGALVIGVAISPWLYLCTFLAALFLAVNKRRAEVRDVDALPDHRPVLNQYTPEFLRTMTSVTTGAALMAYALYTFSAENLPDSRLMMLTIPPVMYGMLRYVYLVEVHGHGEAPDRVIYQDSGILASIAIWLATVFVVLQVSP